MIFHENRLLADDSHDISYLVFVKKIGKILQNLSSAAVMIGALRVKHPVPQKRYKDRTNADFFKPFRPIRPVSGQDSSPELSCP